MAIYNQSDRAFTLTGAKMSSLNSSAPTPLGFFLSSDLSFLLSIPQCVGIRLYNVVTTTIISPVKDDGFEMEHIYFQSRSIPGTDLTQNAIFHNRANASQLANMGSINSRFSSFYSKDVLEGILASGKDGVVIYELDLNSISPADLDNPQDPIISADRSHLIVAVDLINGMLPTEFPLSGENRMSNHPCPGHCLHRNGVSVVAFSSQQTSNPGDPYLFRWQ